MRKHSEQAGDRRRDGSCPFAPGFGEVPPYLAGRLLQQQASLACLDSMRREDQFERCLVMWGPRGNGKTTMLTWIESEARARGIQAISVAAADIETPASLAARISGPPRWRDRLGEVSWKGVSWKAGSLDPAPLDQLLARRLRKAPLALLIDEAHTLDLGVGRTVLSAVQRLGAQGAPVLLVLAGTPGLPYRLREMRATFWERSQILPFDRLDDRAASDAIRIPFESAGRAIAPDALAEAVAESHGYPFFLQLWGKLVWGRNGSSAMKVTESQVRKARAEFELRRNRFYGLRYEELEDMGLVTAAAAVAEAYEGVAQLRSAQIDAVLEAVLRQEGRRYDADAVRATRKDLVSVGYIWEPETSPAGRYVQGLPSLMDLVLQSALQPARSENVA